VFTKWLDFAFGFELGVCIWFPSPIWKCPQNTLCIHWNVWKWNESIACMYVCIKRL